MLNGGGGHIPHSILSIYVDMVSAILVAISGLNFHNRVCPNCAAESSRSIVLKDITFGIQRGRDLHFTILWLTHFVYLP